MLASYALEYVALALAVGGLVGVVAEILVKDPTVFGAAFGAKAIALRSALCGLDVASVASPARQAA
ncbi:hypothetical protein [Prosthecomicrobium sp. N25]|uniref:hypothetical protein n=1 Tax=Prosthecomicrobium sp. N25 TaxID=3129254 RepID=UPI003077C97A